MEPKLFWSPNLWRWKVLCHALPDLAESRHAHTDFLGYLAVRQAIPEFADDVSATLGANLSHDIGGNAMAAKDGAAKLQQRLHSTRIVLVTPL